MKNNVVHLYAPAVRTRLYLQFSALVTVLLCTAYPAHSAGYKICHIGNSLTIHEEPTAVLKQLAIAGGYTDHTFLQSWYPGKTLSWLWSNEAATEDPQFHYGPTWVGWGVALSPPNAWDLLMLEPFEAPAFLDSTACTRFYDSALVLNPNCQLVIYQHWPLLGTSYANTDGTRTVAYFERIASAMQKTHSNRKPVIIAPVGMVVDSLRRLANAGRLPGLTNETQLFDPNDNQHLANPGVWAVAVTWYATIYQKNPATLPNTGFTGSAEAATVIKNLAWGIVSGYAWTRGQPTGVRPATKPQSFNGTTAGNQVRQKGVELYDIRGRAVSSKPMGSNILIAGHEAQSLQVRLSVSRTGNQETSTGIESHHGIDK